MHRLAAVLVMCAVAVGCASATTDSADSPVATASTTSTSGAPPTTAAPENTAAGSTPATEAATDAATFYPDVIDAVATEQDGGWHFEVTISSPYDSPAQYADAWRVLAPDGTELGLRILTHDHASEQPFTRSQSGIQIPADVERVTVEGRDLLNGWGGATLEMQLER